MNFLSLFEAINEFLFEHFDCCICFLFECVNFWLLFFLFLFVLFLEFKIFFVLKCKFFFIETFNVFHHFLIFGLSIYKVVLEKRLQLFFFHFELLKLNCEDIDCLLFVLGDVLELNLMFSGIFVILHNELSFHIIEIFLQEFGVSDFLVDIVSLNQYNFSQIVIHHSNHRVQLIISCLVIESLVDGYKTLSICKWYLINENKSILTRCEEIPSTWTGWYCCYLFQMTVESLFHNVIKMWAEDFYCSVLCACNYSRYVPLTCKIL